MYNFHNFHNFHNFQGEFLDEALVPEVIKKAQPCLFKYTPPVVAEEIAGSAAPEPLDTAEEAGAAEGADDTAGAAGSSASGGEEAKKRKRIQPMSVTSEGATPVPMATVDTTSSSTSSTPVVEGGLPVPPAPGAGEAAQAAAAPEKKVKKRIAPVQVLSADSAAPATISSATASTVVESSVTGSADAPMDV